ncbi:hypothetical protein, partial [Pseudovibrio sp. SPO723]|uniref:hypothetical protein n=1 Tax=Nesiotobacter zosterae TaxID=392721 RepID=UPI0029C2B923
MQNRKGFSSQNGLTIKKAARGRPQTADKVIESPRFMRGLLIQWGMLKKPSPQQTAFEMVSLE